MNRPWSSSQRTISMINNSSVERHRVPQPAIPSRVTDVTTEVHCSTVHIVLGSRNSRQETPSVVEEIPSPSMATAQRRWTPPHQRKCPYVDRGGLPKPPTDSLAPGMMWSGRGIDRPRRWTQRRGPYRTFVARARAPSPDFITSLQNWGEMTPRNHLEPSTDKSYCNCTQQSTREDR